MSAQSMSAQLIRTAAAVLVAAQLLAAMAVTAAAQTVPGFATYRETVDLATDGSAAVTIEVTLVAWPRQEIDLPLGAAAAEGFTAQAGAAPAHAAAVRVGDVRFVRVILDEPPAASQALRVTYAVKRFLDWEKSRSPRGIHALSYTFTNLTTTTIADYGLRIVLPAGYAVNGITSSTPRATGEEVEPPYGFATRDGRVVLSLRAKPVAPGRVAAVAFGFVAARRDPVPVLVIAVLVALAGLYLKRDVLTRATFEPKTAA